MIYIGKQIESSNTNCLNFQVLSLFLLATSNLIILYILYFFRSSLSSSLVTKPWFDTLACKLEKSSWSSVEQNESIGVMFILIDFTRERTNEINQTELII